MPLLRHTKILVKMIQDIYIILLHKNSSYQPFYKFTMSLLLSILSLIVLLPNTVNAAITATSLTESFAFLGSVACNFGILGSLSAYTSIISGDIPHIGSSGVYVQFPDIKVPVLPCDIEIDTSFATEV